MVSLTEGTVEAGQSCTISVDLQAQRAGALETISGDLTPDLPVTTPGASATLTVNEVSLTASTPWRSILTRSRRAASPH